MKDLSQYMISRLGLLFSTDDVCSTFFRNVSKHLPDYAASYDCHHRGNLKSHTTCVV
jgi:hypothetical protein